MGNIQMLCVNDFETTGINSYTCCPIEGYFVILDDELNQIDSYLMKVKPDTWCDEAKKIHKIPKTRALTYDCKRKAWNDFLAWYKPYKEATLCCYSNPNNFGNYIHYDVGIIKNQLSLVFPGQFKFYENFSMNIYSPYEEVKAKYKLKNYKMETVYDHLFGKKYNAHKCVDDVNALIEIIKEIKKKPQLLNL